MTIFVTGATGFVGRAVALRLRRDGHRLLAWVRSPRRARTVLGADVELVSGPLEGPEVRAALGTADAVLHLAGEPVLGKRWTAARKRALVASRVDLTDRLVAEIGRLDRPPRVLVSASAVGIYGDTGERFVDESSRTGEGFLAELCQGWEGAAARAASDLTRVVSLRIGVVLGRGGGALAELEPLFRRGLGGRIGAGRQYVPWIHLHDLVEMIARSLTDFRWSGVVNAVAPEPVTNRELTRALAAAVGRPALLPVPAAALRLLVGGGARVLLDSQRVGSSRLERLGFRFAHSDIDSALADLVGDGDVKITRARQVPEVPYLAARRPRYLLEQRTRIAAPPAELFAFFSRPENLGALTPPEMSFAIEGQPPARIEAGSVIDYTIALGRLPLRWRTVIERWLPGVEFVDAQHRGPYRAWYHEHRFAADGDETVMTDRVFYSPPLGWLGRIANRVFVARMLRGIFAFRGDAIRLRFGTRARVSQRQLAA